MDAYYLYTLALLFYASFANPHKLFIGKKSGYMKKNVYIHDKCLRGETRTNWV